jgi:uncharacterized protein
MTVPRSSNISMRSILLDTGAVAALLRTGDRHHTQAIAFFESLRPTDVLLTTWPVVTECAFLMRRNENLFWDWFTDSSIEVADFTTEDIPAMRAWRSRYADREVDFADSTLVWLAGKRDTNLIATTDFADFATYRLTNGKAFKLLLQQLHEATTG